ncbi:hypothetical protein CJO94_18585 (plasmid) [Ralstonia solanacearum]|nr:hypothetical protein CJO94_18585 [Ralstonia solanacearum]
MRASLAHYPGQSPGARIICPRQDAGRSLTTVLSANPPPFPPCLMRARVRATTRRAISCR